MHCSATSRNASHACGWTRHKRFLGVPVSSSQASCWNREDTKNWTRVGEQRSAKNPQPTSALTQLASSYKSWKKVFIPKFPKVQTLPAFWSPSNVVQPCILGGLGCCFRRFTVLGRWIQRLWALTGSNARCSSSFRQRKTKLPEPRGILRALVVRLIKRISWFASTRLCTGVRDRYTWHQDLGRLTKFKCPPQSFQKSWVPPAAKSGKCAIEHIRHEEHGPQFPRAHPFFQSLPEWWGPCIFKQDSADGEAKELTFRKRWVSGLRSMWQKTGRFPIQELSLAGFLHSNSCLLAIFDLKWG